MLNNNNTITKTKLLDHDKVISLQCSRHTNVISAVFLIDSFIRLHVRNDLKHSVRLEIENCERTIYNVRYF